MTRQNYLKLTKFVFFSSLASALSLFAYMRYGPVLSKDWTVASVMILMLIAAIVISSGMTWLEMTLVRIYQKRRL